MQDFSAGNRIHYKTDDIMDPLHHYMHFYPTPAEHSGIKVITNLLLLPGQETPKGFHQIHVLKVPFTPADPLRFFLTRPLCGRMAAREPNGVRCHPGKTHGYLYNISELQRDLWSESCRGQQLASDFKFEVGGWKGLGRLGKTLI